DGIRDRTVTGVQTCALPILDIFQKSEWFTSLDLVSRYFQVEMEEKDIEKTAFIMNEGLYEYTVMPFRLCNAPATFQRMMHMVLRSEERRVGKEFRSCGWRC